MAKHTLDWGPTFSGVPQFTVFRDPINSVDYLSLGQAPTLPAFTTNGYADFTWTSGGVSIHFRAEILGQSNAGIIAGAIDGLQHLPLGDGTVRVDHDYFGTDNYRVLDEDTLDPIDNAFIWIYLEEDFKRGNTDKNRYLKAWTVTRMDGRWNESVYLDPGNYTLLVTKARSTPKTKALKVWAVTP